MGSGPAALVKVMDAGRRDNQARVMGWRNNIDDTRAKGMVTGTALKMAN